MGQTKSKNSLPIIITVGVVVIVVAVYAISNMPFVREVTLKYKELQLKIVAGEIKEEERRYQENPKTRAAVHLDTIADNAEKGIRAKVDLLVSELYQAEATLATYDRSLANRLLRARPLDNRIADYLHDRTAQTATLHEIAQRIEQQRSLARLLSDQRISAALRLAKEATGDDRTAQSIMTIIQSIATNHTLASNGSAYNFLGNLALALDRRELGFEYLYRAYLNDPTHLPTRASLGYALWKLNGDCQTSLRYTVEGYQLAWQQRQDFQDREKKTLGMLDSLKRERPSLATALQSRANEASRFFAAHGKDIADYLNYQYDDLRGTAAYCMAFERVQEQQARTIADDLLKSSPQDPDYLDTKGFVLMRFHKNATEVRHAVDLFEASSYAATDSHQKELAEHHLSLARKLKQASE